MTDTSGNHSIKLVLDFDNILADSYKTGDEIIDVERASLEAAVDVFSGKEWEHELEIRELFIRIHGLKGRRVGDFVSALLNEADLFDKDLDREPQTKQALLEAAKTFYDMQKEAGAELTPWIPRGKGFNLANLDDAVIGTPDFLNGVVELVTGQKLNYLIPQISVEGDSVWPEPMPGVIEALQTLTRVRQELQQEGINLDVAISSDGHEEFIRKTFEVWGKRYGLQVDLSTLNPVVEGVNLKDTGPKSLPVLLVTDDDVRGAEGKGNRILMLNDAWKTLGKSEVGEVIYLSEEPDKIRRYEDYYHESPMEGKAGFHGLIYGKRTEGYSYDAFKDWATFGRSRGISTFSEGLFRSSKTLREQDPVFLRRWKDDEGALRTGIEGHTFVSRVRRARADGRLPLGLSAILPPRARK